MSVSGTARRPFGGLTDLVVLKQVRGLLGVIRHDYSRCEPPDIPDDELVSAVAAPYTSVDDAFEGLRHLEALLVARGDRRSVFLTVYSRMTRQIRAGIGRGDFENPAWMRAYTVAFANYYRRAFLAFEAGDLDSVPGPWRIAFGTAYRGDALVIQDAFLGINAHINYDLALTLRDVGIDPDRPSKYADHCAVNEILARLVDTQQSTLAAMYAPGIEDIDTTLGRLDERLSLLGLTEGREHAWRVAVVLSATRWSPLWPVTHWMLRTTATGWAAFLRGPGADSELLERLERFEREGMDVTDSIEALRTRLDSVD
ncbi:DUF5995 family protein [Haloarcula nitratireducens]|uniref:Uncharacterized protein n=1 Tax=Haloarcula nitratireducens TaxID=2487749 RepID=A0AAW4PBU3_9EURY|nr:DUF5995 family protein [Halomicroarcula nitratireducens]MBX0295188.1 hypothetical protein [Halomicroarcula nitratireducens]